MQICYFYPSIRFVSTFIFVLKKVLQKGNNRHLPESDFLSQRSLETTHITSCFFSEMKPRYIWPHNAVLACLLGVADSGRRKHTTPPVRYPNLTQFNLTCPAIYRVKVRAPQASDEEMLDRTPTSFLCLIDMIFVEMKSNRHRFDQPFLSGRTASVAVSSIRGSPSALDAA